MSCRLTRVLFQSTFAGCALAAALFVLPPAQAVGEVAEPDAPEAPAPAVVEETPGAPIPIERVEEESSDAPRTTPTVDNPNPPSPTVNNSDIQRGLVGGAFQGSSFGSTGAGGNFEVSAFGARGNAQGIVIVMDASGSMMPFLPLMLKEINRVVVELDEDQWFTLIFFNGKGVFEVPGGGRRIGLRPATPEFKQAAEAWTAPEAGNIIVGGPGSRNVVAAITRGLSYEPNLMFIISDGLTGSGRYEIYQDDLLEGIEEANTREQPTRINTIQVVAHDPLVAMGMTGTLERIAEETGGVYKFLDDSDLRLR